MTDSKLEMIQEIRGDDGMTRTNADAYVLDLKDGTDDRALDLIYPGNENRPDGPSRNRAIYQIEEDVLALTFTYAGPRPAEFGADAETETTCIRCVRKADVATESPSETRPEEQPPKGP